MPPKRRLARPKGSSAGSGSLHSGPKTWEELDCWPLDVVISLLTPGLPGGVERIARLDAYIGHHKFFFTGDYSGIECCREVMRLLSLSLGHVFPDGPSFDFTWTRSCDIGKAQQRFLLCYSHTKEAGCGCVMTLTTG